VNKKLMLENDDENVSMMKRSMRSFQRNLNGLKRTLYAKVITFCSFVKTCKNTDMGDKWNHHRLTCGSRVMTHGSTVMTCGSKDEICGSTDMTCDCTNDDVAC
jgi:hypothetical protein